MDNTAGHTVGEKSPTDDAVKGTVAILAGISFPPHASANVHRVLAWLRHLPRYGWRPVVFSLPREYMPTDRIDDSLAEKIPRGTHVVRTAPLLGGMVKRAAQAIHARESPEGALNATGPIARSAMWLKRNLLLPDTRVLWVPSVARAVGVLRRHQHQRLILLSTSRENSSHIAGWLAARRFHLPWVADFQDPWSSSWDPSRWAPSRWVTHIAGDAVLGRASHITTLSPSLRDSILRDGVPAHKVSVVTNGFDPAERTEPSRGRVGVYRIVHTGRFYGKRNPLVFLQAVDRVLEKDRSLEPKLDVRFIGTYDAEAARVLRSYDDRSWLTVAPQLPHDDVLRAQEQADWLLLVTGEWDALPAKVFEYMRARRPVLALCRAHSDTAKLLTETGIGIGVPPDDSHHLERILQGILTGSLDEVPLSPAARVDAYTWEATVHQMAQVLERVGHSTPHGRIEGGVD